MTSEPVLLVVSDVFARHRVVGHPENQGRLDAAVAYLRETGLWERCWVVPPRPASVEELALVHDRAYIDLVRSLAESGGGWLTLDTIVSPGTYEGATHAAGAGLVAAERILAGEVRRAFCLVRPPGHHARPSRGMGFCIFNNIAVAAAGLLAQGLERVMIFDFDVHHGNGTQDIFWSDPRVLFMSFHLWPHYPGSGLPDEIGHDEGRGYTVNVPFPHGTGNAEYRLAFDRLVAPMAERFHPQVVLVSAGYDGHRDDPLGGLALDEDGYRMMGAQLRAIAGRQAEGRLMFFLEGGYDLRALASSVVATLEGAVLGEAKGGVAQVDEGELNPRALQMLARTLEAIRPFWKGL